MMVEDGIKKVTFFLISLETRDNLVKMARPESRVNLEIKDRLEDLEGTDKMA